MKITGLRVILLTAPWTGDPFWLENFERSAALIEVSTDEGLTGLGETVMGYFCPEVVPPLVDYYRARLLEVELDPLQPEAVFAELYQTSLWWGRVGLAVSVLSGIEMACWDLAGKAAERPVYQLLGGRQHERLPLYASGAMARWPVENAVAQAEFYVEQGFKALKLSTGYRGHPEGTWHAASVADRIQQEHEKLKSLRRALGAGVDLAIDSHAVQVRQAWPISTPIGIAQAIEEFAPLFYEEPLRYERPEDWARVRGATSVPIAGGECLTTADEFAAYLEAGALDYVQPDVTQAGGLSNCRRIAELAAAHGAGLIVHTGAAVGPGLMANLHLAFAQPATRIVEFAPAASDLRQELLVEPVELRHGTVAPPTVPGLGVHLAPSTLERYPYKPGAVEYA